MLIICSSTRQGAPMKLYVKGLSLQQPDMQVLTSTWACK